MMYIHRIKFCIVLLYTLAISSSFVTFSQTFRIQGRTVNKVTNEVIPYVHVGIKNQSIGTISNGKGIFEIIIPQNRINDTLQFSHISYKFSEFPLIGLTTGNEYKIYLEPTSYLIEEAIVGYIKDPKKILKTALSRIKHNYSKDTEFFEAYYREIVKSGNQYFDLIEAIIKLKKTPYNEKDIYKEPVLYSRKYYNYSTPYTTNIITSLIPEYPENIRLVTAHRITDTTQNYLFDHFKIIGGPYYASEMDLVKNKISFLDKSRFYQYNFQFNEIVNQKNRKAYKLSFDQKENIKRSLYTGEIYIDTETYAIVHIRFGLSQLGIKYAKGDDFVYENPLNISVDPVMSRYIIDYKYDNNIWRFNYSYGEVKLRMVKMDINLNTIITFKDELIITGPEDILESDFNDLNEFKPYDLLYKRVEKINPRDWQNYNRIILEKELDDWINKKIRMDK